MKRRNYYKAENTEKCMLFGGKRGVRGQVAVFVIIAILIVAVVLIIFAFPRIKPFFTGQEFTPQSYLRSCIEPSVKEGMDLLARQGGYANPEGFLVYNDQKIKYLCYTSQYYDTCVVQDAMVKNRIEQELNKIIEPRARECAANLKTEYEKRGYSVSQNTISSKTTIDPGKINVEFKMPILVSKGEESNSYQGFTIGIPSQMYDILFISMSIIDYESTYGDSETTLYLQYYPDLKIEKTKLSEGSKVYIVSNVITKEYFQFASRSLSWPPGYRLQ